MRKIPISTHGLLPVLMAVLSILVLSTAPVRAQGTPGPGKVAIVRAFVAALSQGGAASARSFLAPNFTLTLNGSATSGSAALSLLDSLPKPITIISATPLGQIVQSTVPVSLPQASSASQTTVNLHMVEATLQFGSGPVDNASFTGVPGGHILNMTIVGELPLATPTSTSTSATVASTPVSVGPGSGAIVRNFIASLSQGGSAAAQSYLASNIMLTLNGASTSGSAALAALDSLPKPITIVSLTPAGSGSRMVQGTLQIGPGPVVTASFSGSTSGHITNITLTGAIPASTSTPTLNSPPSQGAAVTYAAGWNLVSGPAGTLLTGTQGPLYTLQGSGPPEADYEAIPEDMPLQDGVGYWALFSEPTAEMLPLATATALAISLPPGQFTMIGNPFDMTVTVAGADVVLVYSPTTGYSQSATLAPGQGAWALSFTGGMLAINVAGQ